MALAITPLLIRYYTSEPRSVQVSFQRKNIVSIGSMLRED